MSRWQVQMTSTKYDFNDSRLGCRVQLRMHSIQLKLTYKENDDLQVTIQFNFNLIWLLQKLVASELFKTWCWINANVVDVVDCWCRHALEYWWFLEFFVCNLLIMDA